MGFKKANEAQRQYRGIYGTCSRSKRDVQMYNHFMHKLDSLSSKIVTNRRCIRTIWESTLSYYRREAFAELYSANEIVRCFAKEIPDGPLALLPLDDYALGTMRGTRLPYPRGKMPLPDSTSSGPLDVLGKVRTVVLLDDSGSMTWAGHMSCRREGLCRFGGRRKPLGPGSKTPGRRGAKGQQIQSIWH
jgi:hypothetical protein